MSYGNDDAFAQFLALDDLKESRSNASESTLAMIEDAQNHINENKTRQKEMDDAYNSEYAEQSNNGNDEDDFDWSDISMGDDFLFADEEGYQEPEEQTDDDSETEEGDSEEDSSFSDEDEAEDSEPVEYVELGDVDPDTVLTLPDGRDASIQSLFDNYLTAEALTEREEHLSYLKHEADERISHAENMMNLSMLEADKTIEEMESWDWDALGATDPTAYYENQRILQNFQRRKAELIRIQADIDNRKAEFEANEKARKAAETTEILSKNIPGWGEPLYQTLMEFSIRQGFPESEVLATTSAPFFQAMYKLYKQDQMNQKVSTKLKSPRKVVKGSIHVNNGKGGYAGKGDAHLNYKRERDYAAGRMDQATAFQYLTD